MKVAVIGGGSSYTPELVRGFLEQHPRTPLKELWLMDIDQARLEVVGGFAKRMVAAQGNPFKIILSNDRIESIAGAAYVITQIRVGQMAARREDEYLGQRHGLIGQETTGVGGLANALRTVPAILEIAETIRKEAPDALLLNFTNPSGLITEALSRYAPYLQAVGLCNVPITTKMQLIEELEMHTGEKIRFEDTELDTLGLNHLSWHRDFFWKGRSYWNDLFDGYLERLKTKEDEGWDVATLKSLKMIPNYYLQYYYYTDNKLVEQKGWPPSRAEQVVEIEKSLFSLYAEPRQTTLPEELMKRGGAYYSTLATQLIHAHFNNTHERFVINVPNRGAVADWPEDWVLEMPCEVSAAGIKPLPTQPLPPVCFGLLAHVKAYEILAVEAAVHGDRNLVYQALLAHPLGPGAGQVQSLLDDLLNTHAELLPQFRPR